MPRSEETWMWYTAVYEAIQEIPRGRVTTYSHIAKLLGKRTSIPCFGDRLILILAAHNSRTKKVGICLKYLPSREGDSEFHDGNVPWQRVINAKGEISPRGPYGASRQAVALRREHVEVQHVAHVYSIDMGKFGWFPSTLPSEDVESSDEEE